MRTGEDFEQMPIRSPEVRTATATIVGDLIARPSLPGIGQVANTALRNSHPLLFASRDMRVRAQVTDPVSSASDEQALEFCQNGLFRLRHFIAKAHEPACCFRDRTGPSQEILLESGFRIRAQGR